uniref:ABC transporter domain-containing protein n=1 Tax=Globodera rostochiensis TaxID=31243 RepID=A0A914H5Y9_GLORO
MFAIIHLYKRYYKLGRYKVFDRFLSKSDASKKRNSEKAHVDSAFVRRLLRILRILIPGPFSMELFFMALIALSLLLRTYADVWMIQTSTKIEAAIISRNKPRFWKSLANYFLCMPLVSVINSFLKLSLCELKLRFRERLTHHFYAQYLNGFTFYKMTNLDNRIANADQLLTQDVDRFCEGIVELYSNLSKPLVDVLLYVNRIGASIGWQAPLQLFVYLLFSGTALTYLRRPIGRMTVMEQQLEGDFRFVNSRLIVNSEEIAFYQGNERERVSVLNAFQRMITHLRSLVLFRFSIAFMDNIVAKYVATVVGWSTLSRPYFNEHNEGMMRKNKTELMQAYYTTGRMMVKLADALGRLALAGREMTRLAGFTARVDQLMSVLDDLEQGNYKRTMVGTEQNGGTKQLAANGSGDGAQTLAIGNDATAFLSAEEDATLAQAAKADDDADGALSQSSTFRPGTGHILVQDNLIRFQRVPLVTPNGDLLIRSLDFEVPSGTNVLVCGPNGCGKSSLFRVLGELWPLWGGTMIKPAKGKLFYVPQRPYMTIGTLRDQVIYPDRPAEMRRRGFTDGALEALLEHVQLRNILDREGGWEGQQDWMDVLSGGEKQRIAMARLFYHSPQFAILDECTSAVSADVEDAIYRRCHELGITLFTVSHRKSLWKHHDFSLHMDGRGHYEFKRINHDNPDEQFGS